MSKVTDRLDNQNIVNLAKQQYEKQQRAKVPGYVAPLTSAGIIYPETSPLRQGYVEMRYMTAYDEDILTNNTYHQNNIVFQKLIESLLITDGVDIEDLSNPDLEGLLITARINAYGKMYPVVVTDPNTNKVYEREVDLSVIQSRNIEIESNELGEFEWISPASNTNIHFKYLSIRDTKSINPDRAISDILRYSIQSVNGNRDRNFIEQFIKYEFRAAESKEFRQYMAKHMHGLDYNLEFEGENGSTFTSRFQPGSDLFWI